MLRAVALVAGLTTALPAIAGEMTASEARQFVVEKLFSYTCFDGTRGMARVAAPRSTPAMLLFGTDERRKLPRFDRRIELRLLRLHTSAYHVGELKGHA
jgi:hypothetical protein